MKFQNNGDIQNIVQSSKEKKQGKKPLTKFLNSNTRGQETNEQYLQNSLGKQISSLEVYIQIIIKVREWKKVIFRHKISPQNIPSTYLFFGFFPIIMRVNPEGGYRKEAGAITQKAYKKDIQYYSEGRTVKREPIIRCRLDQFQKFQPMTTLAPSPYPFRSYQ